MRQFPDGTIWLPKPDAKKEAELDKTHDRIPGELKWVLRSEDQGLEKFKNIHQDVEIAYIVGKGPSLDKLTGLYFNPKLPIFAINEAIHKLERLGLHLTNPLYCVQQDWNLRKTCQPKYGKHFLSRSAYVAAANPNSHAYNPKLLGATGNSLSADIAMRIAAKMGVKMCMFYGFDASINKNTSYAKEIGYLPDIAGDPKRFLGHRKILERSAKELNLLIEFVSIE